MNLLDKINQEQVKADRDTFNVGDTVRVHTRVVEGEKERVQIFAGVVIARRHSKINATFTVRRISYGEGVERVFPIHSPRIARIEVEREGAPRRAKLNYLRGRTGRDALLVREKKKPVAVTAADKKAKKEKVAAGKKAKKSAADLIAEAT